MNTIIEPAAYEFVLSGDGADATHVGLVVIDADGNRTTVAVAVPDAEVIGKLLVAHHDAVTGRPPRTWS